MKKIRERIEEIKDKKLISNIGRKPIILLDQDDILADHDEEIIRRYNKKYKTNFTIEDITCWEIASIMGKEVEQIMFDPELFKDLPIVEGCYENLKILYESNLFEFYICTAAHPAAMYNKYNWIKEYLPFFNKRDVIFTYRKDLINGDLLFDDGPHNIEAFKKDVIIMDKPYNRYIKNRDRVHNWEQFAELLLKKFY